MIRSLSRFAITSYIRNGNWSNYASLPNRLVQAKRLLSIRGLDNSIWMFNSTENLNFIIFPNLCWPWFFPKAHLPHVSTGAPFFCLNGKKYICHPPTNRGFFTRKKTHSFPNATSCVYAPGGVLKPVPLKSDPPGRFMTGSGCVDQSPPGGWGC